MERDKLPAATQSVIGSLYQLYLPFRPFLKHQEGDKLHEIRDSVAHRVASVRFHIDLLYRFLDQYAEDLRKDVPFKPKHSVMTIADNASYLFDDIIFNLDSAFDYLAGYIAFLITNDEREISNTWYDLQKTIARAKKTGRKYKPDIQNLDNELMRYPIFCTNFLKADEIIVKQLAKYRGLRYHVRSDEPNAKTSSNYKHPERSTLTVTIPTSVHEAFPILLAPDTSIDKALLLLINESFEAIYTLSRSVQQDHRAHPTVY
jgi:hypothetical protein